MLATTSSNPLEQHLVTLRGAGRRALVAYLTAGHPDRERSVALLQGMESAGVDVVEVGIPFSDPMADGPVIQRSSQIALEQGTDFGGVLDIVRQAQLRIPVVLFSYLNPLMAAGRDGLTRARDAGVQGLLVTDLPVGADVEREQWIGESGLAFVRLVAPTTPTDRMRLIGEHGSGFVYLISRLGVTGVRSDVPADLAPTVARLRTATQLPICVGFGISTPEQAATVAHIADGVVVGSALVREAETSVERAVALAGAMRRALDRA